MYKQNGQVFYILVNMMGFLVPNIAVYSLVLDAVPRIELLINGAKLK